MAPIRPVKPKNPGMRPKPSKLDVMNSNAKHPWEKGYKVVKNVVRDIEKLNPF